MTQINEQNIGVIGIREVARQMGKSVWTIQRWCKCGLFPRPFQFFAGGPQVWRTSDIDRFLEKRKRARRVPPTPRGKLKKPRRRVRIKP